MVINMYPKAVYTVLFYSWIVIITIYIYVLYYLDMTMATDCTRDMHQDGIILPRKPVNPCLTSADHQNLHRELLFNQKMYTKKILLLMRIK